MRTKRRILWILAATLVAGAAWLHFRHSAEPRYHGKRVSEWFKEYYTIRHGSDSRFEGEAEAIAALRAMGSNALPYLVEVALNTNQDSPARTNFYNLLAKLPDSWHLPELISRDEIRAEALEVIRQIGPSAADILPLLQDELDQTNTQQHREAIFLASGVSNHEAMVIPYLARAIHEPDAEAQALAFQGLVHFGRKSALALPDVLQVFQSAAPASPIRVRAANILGLLESDATPAIPVLKEAFEAETNWQMRCRFAGCLGKIDRTQTYAFDYLAAVLTNDISSERISVAAGRLGYIGSNASFCIPAILSVAETTNCDASAMDYVFYSLRHVGASREQIVALLRLKLRSESSELRQSALENIKIFDQTGREEESALLELVQTHSELEHWAIVELGRMNPTATNSLLTLREEMNSTNSDLARAAGFAVRRIEPKSLQQ